MKKRENKISNKLYYSLITVVAILLIGVGVYAYGGTTPSTLGHTIGEIEPPPGCSAGQVLRMVPAGVGWDCVNVVSSIPSTYVRNVEIVSSTGSGSGTKLEVSTTCPSGKKVIGGGCEISVGIGSCLGDENSFYKSRPFSASGTSDTWECGFTIIDTCQVYAVAICANVD